MAKSTETTAVDPVVQPQAVGSFDIALDEFCKRLSAKKVSPQLISGFYHGQQKAGNVKGSDAAFTAAFAAFVKQPA